MKRQRETPYQEKARKAVRSAYRTLATRKITSRAPMRNIGVGYGMTFNPSERKVLDTVIAAASFWPALGATTGVVNLLNGTAQGDDFNNRDGRKFKMDSLYLRGDVNVVAGTTGAAAENLRIAIVYDRQSNSAALPASSALYTPDNLVGHINMSNRARFQVLYDKEIGIGNVAQAALVNSGNLPTTRYIKKLIKLNGLETVNSGTTAQ